MGAPWSRTTSSTHQIPLGTVGKNSGAALHDRGALLLAEQQFFLQEPDLPRHIFDARIEKLGEAFDNGISDGVTCTGTEGQW